MYEVVTFEEMQELRWYYIAEPFGDYRADIRAGVQTDWIVHSMAKTKATAKDMTLRFEHGDE